MSFWKKFSKFRCNMSALWTHQQILEGWMWECRGAAAAFLIHQVSSQLRCLLLAALWVQGAEVTSLSFSLFIGITEKNVYWHINWLKYFEVTWHYASWHEVGIQILLIIWQIFYIYINDNNESYLLRTYYVPSALQELFMFLTHFILTTLLLSRNNFTYFLISHLRKFTQIHTIHTKWQSQ